MSAREDGVETKQHVSLTAEADPALPESATGAGLACENREHNPHTASATADMTADDGPTEGHHSKQRSQEAMDVDSKDNQPESDEQKGGKKKNNPPKAGKLPKQRTRAEVKQARAMAFVPTEEPSLEQIEAAASVLSYFAQDKDHCDKLRNIQSKAARALRSAAVRFADEMKKFYFEGKSQEELTKAKKEEFAKKMRATRMQLMRELDNKHSNKALLRAARLESLSKLTYREDEEILAIASGNVDGMIGYSGPDATQAPRVTVEDLGNCEDISDTCCEPGSRKRGSDEALGARDEASDASKRICTPSERSDSTDAKPQAFEIQNVKQEEEEKEPPKIRVGRRAIMESVKQSTVNDFIKVVSSSSSIGDVAALVDEAMKDVYSQVRLRAKQAAGEDSSSSSAATVSDEAGDEQKQAGEESTQGVSMASSGGVHAEADLFDESDDKDLGPTLFAPRSCYVCHRPYFRLHKFYADLCPPCARINWKKRHQVADMTGYTVLLTGARVKIGFECGLRLLRCGATVIGTSRFPHDTAKRYAELPDYHVWKDRLHVYGLDLRDLKAVVDFCDMICQKYDSLDAIINNAAQTVRRPVYYYQHLLEDELLPKEELPEKIRDVVKGDAHSMYHYGRGLLSTDPLTKMETKRGDRSTEGSSGGSNPSESSTSVTSGGHTATSTVTVEEVHDTHMNSSSTTQASIMPSPTPTVTEPSILEPMIAPSTSTVPTMRSLIEAMEEHARARALSESQANGGLANAALLSQLVVTREDQDSAMAKFFPRGLLDITGQQLDLRPKNSWNLKLKDVDPGELVETFAINALAPFIINSRLFRLMKRNDGKMRFVVNVSAMEGKFYRHKLSTHPHTNMAKAALNMLTRTSAQDYARYGVYMNSVDTGWINDEHPFQTQIQKIKERDFQTPIDEVDAMARILDPIFDAINSKEPIWGRFLKDYHATEW